MRGSVNLQVGLFAVGLAACGLGGAEPAAGLEPTAPPAHGTAAEAAAPRITEERFAAAPSSATLEALPWAERIPLERALAANDPRHAPRLDARGAPTLGHGPLTARFDASGAHVALGAREFSLRAVSIGRGEERAPLAEVRPVVAGPEVRAERAPGVTEWWRSLPSGLEHGLTVTERPAGEGELRVELALGGGLRAATRSDDAVELRDADGVAVATYAHLAVIDANGALMSARLTARAEGILVEINDAGAHYPVVVDPLVQTAFEPPGLGDFGTTNLGWFVSLSNDGGYALVSGIGYGGGARIFVRSGAEWGLQANLSASGSVALSGDATRAIVGRQIFRRTGSTWAGETTLLASGTEAPAGFGSAVGMNADGSRAIVGAPSDNSLVGSNVGTARVFTRDGTSWREEAALYAADGQAGDQFGISVALCADGNCALVGASRDDTALGVDAGSAHVFVNASTGWVEEASLVAADGRARDLLGTSVSLSADGSRALVGAPGDSESSIGRAWVFMRTPTGWAEESSLVDAGGAPGFGTSVALSSEGDRALVGAPYTGGPLVGSGSAYVFLRTSIRWEQAVILLTDPDLYFGKLRPYDLLGYAVSLSSDGSRALVGVPGSDGGACERCSGNSGEARVFVVRYPVLDGTPCGGSDTCLSGFCVDGVCCDTACGGGATNDCEACSAALTGGPSGTCAGLAAGVAPTVTCRPVAGLCDTAEVCTPSRTDCPADGFRAAGTSCRGASGTCDAAEFCTGTSPSCPTDVGAPATHGTLCRPAAGSCDSPEVCDGVNALCPPDAFAAIGTVCRDSVGSCDVAESCSGTGAACPADAVRARGTECRPATPGSCDVAEVCDGIAGACPTDRFLPSTERCRAAFGECDVSDFCTGISGACPDSRRAAGSLCRGALGPCDAAEFCDGLAFDCPDDLLRSAGTVCQPSSGGVCDVDDVCTGSSAECLPRFLSGVECRGARGACDTAEVCAGSSAECPPDALLAAGVVCRAATDPTCDPAEACDGTSGACPADEMSCVGPDGGTKDAGTVGRADAGPVDAATQDGGASGTDGGASMDAGTAPISETGCGCRAGGRRGAGLGVLVALALALGLRRR
jgi:hypothetical protein